MPSGCDMRAWGRPCMQSFTSTLAPAGQALHDGRRVLLSILPPHPNAPTSTQYSHLNPILPPQPNTPTSTCSQTPTSKPSKRHDQHSCINITNTLTYTRTSIPAPSGQVHGPVVSAALGLRQLAGQRLLLRPRQHRRTWRHGRYVFVVAHACGMELV